MNSQQCAANRETVVNKKLILTAIFIFEEGFLTIEQIYKGLGAYELQCRRSRTPDGYPQYLYNENNNLREAMKLVDFTINPKWLEDWLKKSQ